MPTPFTVRLLAVEPDLGRFMAPEALEVAAEMAVPTRDLERGQLDASSLLREAGAYAAMILDGMVLHHLQIGDQPALRLLGPGDILSLSGTPPSMLGEARCTVAAPTRVAMFSTEILTATHRWPRLVAGLHARMAEQGERLGTQLAICQLPRVEQRLLALLWLLAESWGQVTPVGTRLPLSLTHDVLGGLIGARRPTVTLALRDLTERGAITRQDGGWLLLERPPLPNELSDEAVADPVLVRTSASDWVEKEEDREAEALRAHAELHATVRRLQERHRNDAEHFRERMARLKLDREQAARSRHRRERQGLSRGQAPSS